MSTQRSRPVESPRRFPVGVPHLDDLLIDGQAAGEVYVMVGSLYAGGPYHAQQITVGTAEVLHARSREDGLRRVACLASYSLRHSDLEPRILSCGAEVSFSRLLYECDPELGKSFSRRGSLQPYEVNMYERRGNLDVDDLPGEEERLHRFSSEAGRALIEFDMTGASSGFGGVDELARRLRAVKRAGLTPGALVVDCVDMAVMKQSMRRRSNRSEPAAIRTFIVEARRRLAVPFGIPVWLMVRGQSSERSSATPERHRRAMAAEAAALNESTDAAFCTALEDEESKIVRLSRVGVAEPRECTDRLIQLDFEFSRFRKVGDPL